MNPADFRPDIRVSGWMTDKGKANLKGSAALVYAVVYQMTTSPNGEGCYYAGLDILAGWLNEDKSGLRKSLASLTRKGYIITKRKRINRVERTTYTANLELANRWK